MLASLFVNASNALPGDGTASNPYQTIAAATLAATQSPDSDVIEIAFGSYAEAITIRQHAGDITFRGDPVNRPTILAGPGVSFLTNDTTGAITFENLNFVQSASIFVYNSQNIGTRAGSLTCRNLTFDQSGSIGAIGLNALSIENVQKADLIAYDIAALYVSESTIFGQGFTQIEAVDQLNADGLVFVASYPFVINGISNPLSARPNGNATLSNLTIVKTNSSGEAFKPTNLNSLSVTGLKISNVSDAIVINQVQSTTIKDALIDNVSSSGILVTNGGNAKLEHVKVNLTSTGFAALRLFNVSTIDIYSTSLKKIDSPNFSFGLNTASFSKLTVRGLAVTGFLESVDISAATGVLDLDGLDVGQSTFGVWINRFLGSQSSAKILVSNSIFHDNVNEGLMISSADEIVLDRVVATRNANGPRFDWYLEAIAPER